MASLSVIVPAHNDQATIRPALRSVERAVAYLRGRSGHEDVAAEVVVVDDGSRDGTLAAALDAARGNPLFRVYHRPAGSSPGSARNCGAALASGELLFFLDADDEFMDDHLYECCRAFEDPAVEWVKTGVALAEPIHPDWKWRLGNSLVINLAVRRRCHDFIGGFPDVHLFRRRGDAFEPWLDIFRLIEDVHYNSLLARLFRKAEVARETVRYVRRPGNSLDRQHEKFRKPPGEVRDPADPEFDLRVRLSKAIVEYLAHDLGRRKAEAAADRG